MIRFPAHHLVTVTGLKCRSLLACLSLSLSLTILSPITAPVSWAGSDSLSRATALYNKGAYKEASDILSVACAGELKADATAHYYLANALAKLGNRQEAYRQYGLAKSLAQDATLASYCQRGMDVLSGATAGSASKKATGEHGPAPGSNKIDEGNGRNAQNTSNARQAYDALYPDPTKIKIDPSTLDTSMITILRRTENTNFVLYQIDQALKKLPAGVKQTFQSGGLQIVEAPTMLDALPEMAGDRPTAYVHGGGYENCPGLFDGKGKIYIPEKAQYRSNVAQLNRWVLTTILHEMGHAFDHYKSGLSSREPFSKDYEEELGRLTNGQRVKHYYYTQPDAGPKECFAELFSYVMNPDWIKFNADAADLAQCFPRCMADIKKVAN